MWIDGSGRAGQEGKRSVLVQNVPAARSRGSPAGPAAAVHKDRQGNAAMNNNQNQITNNMVKPSSLFDCAGTVSATEKQKTTELRNASLMT